jgi:hypothetical protein
VPVEWAGEQPIVPAPRHWKLLPPSPRARAERPVCLLYPPASADRYALIIDGTTGDAGPDLTVSITRAVLHRRGRPGRRRRFRMRIGQPPDHPAEITPPGADQNPIPEAVHGHIEQQAEIHHHARRSTSPDKS